MTTEEKGKTCHAKTSKKFASWETAVQVLQ